MKNYQRLGDYIREVNVRNSELKVTKLVGLIIDKAFIPSVANVIGTDLSNYKVIRKEQFACSLMQVSRDGKMPVAMFEEDEAIMSPAYPMFEVVDKTELLPQYLMMWFSRKEFDREASFYAVGGVRGSLTWEDFCNLRLPIPSIARQREIVEEYETLSRRIRLNEKMIVRLEETAQALYRKMFVDGVDRENLPEGWRRGTIENICEVRDGTHDSPKPVEKGFPLVTSAHLLPWSVLLDQTYPISLQDYRKINERSLVETKDILFSMIGTVGTISFVSCENVGFAVKNMAIFKTSHNSKFAEYLLFFLKSEEMNLYIVGSMSGSTQNYVTLNTLRETPILIPEINQIEQFHKIAATIVTYISKITLENLKLTELQSLLLARMGK